MQPYVNDNIPADLRLLHLAQSRLGELLPQSDDVAPDNDADLLDDGEDADDAEDVIGEDDDNPYQDSDEALPEDGEEKAIDELLRQ